MLTTKTPYHWPILVAYRGVLTIVLEVMTSSYLWIWHAFFGVVGSNNDFNILNHSPLFDKVLEGHAPKVNYTINGTNYTMGYYLTNDIYLEWAKFVKTICRLQGDKWNCLQNIKKSNERMWNEHLECCKLASQLYVAQHDFGIKRSLGE